VRVDGNNVAAVVMGVMVGGDENEASASDPVGKGSATEEVHGNVGEVAGSDEETDGAAADEKVEIDDVLIVSDETDGIEADDIDDIDTDETDVDADVDADDIVDEMVGIITDEAVDIEAEIDERSRYIADLNEKQSNPLLQVSR